MTRPLIAVPTYPRLEAGRVRGWADDGVGVPARYVDALRRAGGHEALFLPEPWSDDEAAALLERVDGLLLIGGGDLDPATYAADRDPRLYGISPARDTCELALSRAALAHEVPTLAICRGHQVLAVALGGTLDQHITGRDGLVDHGKPGADDGARRHPVAVEPDSRLGAALGAATVDVSSHHHQAVRRVGPGVRIVATAPDGIIEGIELADDDAAWVVGVQWHPEDTAGADPVQQGLFDAFVERCRASQTAARR